MISTYLTLVALAVTITFIVGMSIFNTRFLKAEREKEDKYKFLISKLWNIIDDIDTYSDVAKADDSAYRMLVMMKQRERWDLGITTDGQELEYDLSQVQPHFEEHSLIGGDGRGLSLYQAFEHMDSEDDAVPDKDVAGLTTDVRTGQPADGNHFNVQEVADAYKVPVETLMPNEIQVGSGLVRPEAPSVTLPEIRMGNAVQVYGPIDPVYQEDGYMQLGSNLYLKDAILYRKEGEAYIAQKMQVVDADMLGNTIEEGKLYGNSVSPKKMWMMLSENNWEVCVPSDATVHCIIPLNFDNEFVCHAKPTN